MSAPTLTTPGVQAGDHERTVFAQAIRYALAAGWYRTSFGIALPDPARPGRHGITIDWAVADPDVFEAPEAAVIITLPTVNRDRAIILPVTSVQQAVDVLAALVDDGHHLTSGALLAWPAAVARAEADGAVEMALWRRRQLAGRAA